MLELSFSGFCNYILIVEVHSSSLIRDSSYSRCFCLYPHSFLTQLFLTHSPYSYGFATNILPHHIKHSSSMQPDLHRTRSLLKKQQPNNNKTKHNNNNTKSQTNIHRDRWQRIVILWTSSNVCIHDETSVSVHLLATGKILSFTNVFLFP